MSKSEKFWDKRANEFYENDEKKFEQTYRKTVENTRKHLNIGFHETFSPLLEQIVFT
ncbi:MAG: hypothetical protein ACW98I_05080 [Candidatus Hodarchaeales archaeon]